MTNDLTLSPTFSPTPAMRVWLDVSMETLSDNVSEIATRCNVTRQAWYQWLKDDNFREWYEKEWNKRILIFKLRLDLIGLRKAERDFKYWEAMQIRLGNLGENRSAFPVTNTLRFVEMNHDS